MNTLNDGKKSKIVYLIGIKGVGMAALAVYFKKSDFEVFGSDTAESFVTDQILQTENITVFNGFDAKNLKGLKPDLVVISAGYGSENPEVKEAKKRRLNVKYYSEALAEISSDKKVIAVAGVHGKTTISAMLSLILEKAGIDPSFVIGAGKIPNFKASARKGNGDYFVIEADEYRKSPEDNSAKFLDLSPQIAIVSSIELDHPDVYPTIESIFDAFYRFVCRVPRSGFIVLNADYPRAKKLVHSLADRHFETYGQKDGAKWQIVEVTENEEKTAFSLKSDGKVYGPFELKVPGVFNILNATAAIVTAFNLDIAEKIIKKALLNFQNVKRRFEILGSENDIVIIDDYAHHPTAITETLTAVKTKYPKSKIWCVFQPHTYSRTEKLLAEFGSAFKLADKIIITDIYSSAREKDGQVTSVNLVDEIKKNEGSVNLITKKEDIVEFLADSVKAPAVVLTMGAGDVYKIALEFKKKLQKG